jgi:hypothetical protein
MGRTLPDGRPAPPTAPDAELLDDADLRGIRDALRQGKKVGLGSDGKIHVFDTPEGDPIDIASETFIEGKLGEVRSLLQHGFNATLHPSGEISANSHDGRFMYQADEAVALTAADRDGIRRMLVGGADVGITPDGTIQFSQAIGATTRSLNQADRVMAELDRQISSGRVASEAAAGRGLTISAREDGAVEFGYQDAPRIPGFALPEDGLPADRVDDLLGDPSGRAMAAQGRAMDARAEQLRAAALGHHATESGRLAAERDDATRRQAMAGLGADQATRQMTDAQHLAAEEADTARRLELEAIAAERSGDTARAEELFESAELHRSQQAVHQRRSDAAFAERQRLLQERDEQGVRAQGAGNEMRIVAGATERQVRWAEDLDDRAELVARSAAAAAAGDHQRAEELADQALIELVDEPTDFVGDLSTSGARIGGGVTATPPPAPTPDPTPAPLPDDDRRPFPSPNPGPFGMAPDGGDAGDGTAVVASIDLPADPPAEDVVVEAQLPEPEPDLEPEVVADAGTDLADGALDG